MKKALCIENADGSFSIQIDGDLAKSIGFTDQMVAEASFDSQGDLVVAPYRDPGREAEIYPNNFKNWFWATRKLSEFVDLK